MKDYVTYLETLIDLSRVAREDLPTYGSWSCFDLGVLLVKDALDGNAMTIKQVSRSLPCSESNIRRYLRVLESDGWLTIQPNPRDNRSSLVVPSGAMVDAYKRFFLRHAVAARKMTSLDSFCGNDSGHSGPADSSGSGSARPPLGSRRSANCMPDDAIA